MMLHVHNPAWWLMGAAVLPLAVHLLSRCRPKQRLFSSVTMLQDLVRLQMRRTRPRDRILLLLRTLLCACLAAAFLQPYWGNDEAGDAKRVMVLVLDNTASMAAADAQVVRMNRAVELARAEVKALAPADRVNFITTAGISSALFDVPESAQALVLRRLAKTACEPAAAADMESLLASAAQQLEHVQEHQTGELLLISDFQRSGTESALATLLQKYPNVPLRCLNVAQTLKQENTCIESVTVSPAKPIPGQEVQVTVGLRHFAGSAQTPTVLNVTLAAGDLRLSQPCELPPDGQGTAVFSLSAPQEQVDWVLKAYTEKDAFSADNERYAVVPVRSKLSCLAITPDRARMGFVLRVLENIPYLQTLQLPSMPESGADFVVWQAPAAADVAAIRALLKAGAVVMVLPDLVKDTACGPLLAGQDAVYTGEVKTDGSHWKTEFAVKDDALFELFEPAALQRMQQEAVYARLGGDFGKSLPVGSSVPVRYADGVPALVRCPVGGGCLLVWNMPVTSRDNRWAYSPLCLPLVAELMSGSRSTGGAEAELVAGVDYLQLELPTTADPDAVRLVDAAGADLPTVEQRGMLRSVQTVRPGIYRWLVGNEVLKVQAVNFPNTESDLLSFVPEFDGKTAAPVAFGQQEATANSKARVELWPWLLACALAFFVAELWICRTQKTSPEPGTP